MNLFSKFLIKEKLKELNNQESKLLNSVIEIYKADKTKSNLYLPRDEIFNEYSLVHEIYSKLSSKSIDALKRGLFIQWYCYTEPQYLTGIGNLKRDNENNFF